jgi:seryl-tRNA synthetase
MSTEENYRKELEERSNALSEELKELEITFNRKKEEFLKIQGALEMLAILSTPAPKISDEP